MCFEIDLMQISQHRHTLIRICLLDLLGIEGTKLLCASQEREKCRYVCVPPLEVFQLVVLTNPQTWLTLTFKFHWCFQTKCENRSQINPMCIEITCLYNIVYNVSHTHVHTYTYLYIHIHIYIYTYTYLHIYIYTYTHVHIYSYIHIHRIYIYIHNKNRCMICTIEIICITQ